MLLRRLYRIFQRYADIHVSFDLPTPPSLKGRIAFNPIAVRGNRMWITGQTQADKVSLQINRTTREITPRAWCHGIEFTHGAGCNGIAFCEAACAVIAADLSLEASG
jgi:hypothetical protein